LKEIFFSGNELIKIEVLKAMQESEKFDPDFIFPLLKEKSTILRREALAVLLKDDAAREKAIDMLLGMRSPWGMKNQLLLENILVIEELDVRQARNYLVLFSKKKFFWNRRLRDKALEALESWEWLKE